MTSIVGLVIMMVLAMGVFGLSFFAYGLALMPFILIIFLFGIALGILGCALLLRLGPSGEWLIWPIPAVISPFSAVFYPLSTLPLWMQGIGHAIPTTYVFESIRSITTGGTASWISLATGTGLAIFYIILACLIFLRVHRKAIMSGAIARYSAESY
jgi:ABC-2 type transport system permease protein